MNHIFLSLLSSPTFKPVNVLEKEAKKLKNGGTCSACGRKYNRLLQTYLKERKKFSKRDIRDILGTAADASSAGRVTLKKGRLTRDQSPDGARNEVVEHFQFLADHVAEPSRHMAQVLTALHHFLYYESAAVFYRVFLQIFRVGY